MRWSAIPLLLGLLVLQPPECLAQEGDPAEDEITVPLTLTPSKTAVHLKVYGARGPYLVFKKEVPKTVKKPPPGKELLWASVEFGGKAWTLALEPDEPKLYVDRNGDGDLSAELPIKAVRRNLKRRGKTHPYFSGSFSLPLAGENGPKVTLTWFGSFRRERLLCRTSADYGAGGFLELDGKRYRMAVLDSKGRGDFTLNGPTEKHLTVYVDLNGDGRFDRKRERYLSSDAFKVGDRVLEVVRVDQHATGITLRPTTRKPKELPPDLSAGKTMPAFEGPGLDGQPVKFPTDYAGKVVLIDFWATWCGPCRREIPAVKECYERFRGKGFDILSISLDSKRISLEQYVEQNDMPWKQIFDGKGWKAALAKRFGVTSIPFMVLVEADSGRIIASGTALRGKRLEPAIEKAMGAKKQKGSFK